MCNLKITPGLSPVFGEKTNLVPRAVGVDESAAGVDGVGFLVFKNRLRIYWRFKTSLTKSDT